MRSIALGLAASTCLLLGCQSAPRTARTIASPPVARHPAAVGVAVPVAYEEEIVGDYDIQQFVADVVATHPSIDALVAAWQAAIQRYPQAVALDDPMFMAMTAPASLSSKVAESAYALEIRQKLPWFGKRQWRGAIASDEAAAAAYEVDDAKLNVALLAQNVYIEYYLADQQVELNAQASELVRQFREIAQTRYRTNQVTQQDVLQVDLELAELSRRELELRRMRRVATARMNTFLLRSPDQEFPKPDLAAPKPSSLDDSQTLFAWAEQNRPDLQAQAHRIDAESAKLALAYKQYFPDAELFGRYDTFWQPASMQGDLRGQVGVSVNLPVYRRKLDAAVCEAQFRLRQEQAKYEQLAAEIRLEVQVALEQANESSQALELYESKLLPAAEQYLESVRSNYAVGKATSLDFVQAQRQLLAAREKRLEALTDLAQRLAELDRSVGGMRWGDRPR